MDGETGRQGEGVTMQVPRPDRAAHPLLSFALSSCLLVSLSPCLLVFLPGCQQASPHDATKRTHGLPQPAPEAVAKTTPEEPKTKPEDHDHPKPEPVSPDIGWMEPDKNA